MSENMNRSLQDDDQQVSTGRRLAREVVIQLLYEDDLNPSRMAEDPQEYVRQRLHHEPAGLAEFALQLILGVRQHRDQLDAIILESAENWTIARMAPTDRNTIRLGAYEITQSETPGEVVIHEAVELAKRFGTKDSGGFVNGVLDKILHANA